MFARYGNTRMTKSAKTYIRLKAVVTFNQVERSPLIKSIKSLLQCLSIRNMFSLISDQSFIFQRLQWNLHQAELTQAELTQGRLDSRADLTSGRVDPLPFQLGDNCIQNVHWL